MNDIYETPLVDLCWESEFRAEDGLESAVFMETEDAGAKSDEIDGHWATASR